MTQIAFHNESKSNEDNAKQTQKNDSNQLTFPTNNGKIWSQSIFFILQISHYISRNVYLYLTY